MSNKNPLDKIFVEPFENRHIWRRRFEMLIFTILNALLAVISIISLGATEGWQKLTQFPYMALWIYLIVFAFFAFDLMWNRAKEDIEEKDGTNKKFDTMILLLISIAECQGIDIKKLLEAKIGESKKINKPKT